METITVCKTCGLLQRVQELLPGTSALCSRCGSTIRRQRVASLSNTAAFALAALVFYLPANVYPILRMDYYGVYSDSTIWDGCVNLFREGEWLVAAIIFFASILIPLLKLLGLFFLIVTTKYRSPRWQLERTRIYRIISVIGPWAMLDVFLLSVLVGLVRLRQIATVLPGPGLLAFTAVVICSILASANFRPELIWDDQSEAG